MLKIDNQLLKDLGLGSLPHEERDALLRQMYETLQIRVGEELAAKMSDDQLDEFEVYVDKNDEKGAQQWLETNFPNYRDVVASQLEKLKEEVRSNVDAIKSTVDPSTHQATNSDTQ